MMKTFFVAACVSFATFSAGCGEESTSPTTASPAQAPVDNGHAHADGTTHAPHPDAPTTTAAEHGRIPIGQTSQGGLKLVATQDAPVKPGGEGAFDVVITGGKPKAVRFWVGAESGEGSVKAKAEEETPDHWHTHVEVPDALPAGSKLWVEVEPQTGQPFKTSFDVKQS